MLRDADLTQDLILERARAAGWEKPIAFHEWRLPAFPTGALPGWWRDCVEASATATQTPVDMPATLSLASVAACVQGRARVRVKGDYSEPLNLYIACVMEPANRKSSVQRMMAGPIEEYERGQVERLSPEIEAAASARRMHEARLKRAEEAAAKCDTPKERRGLEEEAKQLATELATLPRSFLPRYVADDATPEQLATLTFENSGRMAVLSAEGTIFDLVLGRYDKNGAPNMDFLLKAHSGDPVRIDRRGRTEHIANPAVTLGLAVQPQVLRGLGRNSEVLRGKGLLARFLYSIPRSFVGSRDVDPPGVSVAVRDRYAAALTGLLSRVVPKEAFIVLSEEARRAHLSYAAAIEKRLGAEGDLHVIQDWAGKLLGAVTRVAGLLHAAENWQTEWWSEPISSDTMTKAMAVGDYFIAHAQAAFGEMGADPDTDRAKTLLRWLQKTGIERFSARDAYMSHRSLFRPPAAETVKPALTLLRDHRIIRPEGEGAANDSSDRPTGRPPSPTFEVSPLLGLLTQKTQKAQNPTSVFSVSFVPKEVA